ncbi:MAG TPA: response regulator, partial [Chryseolinea sp.]|nr:response regulator [Chryseolinea sp.]
MLFDIKKILLVEDDPSLGFVIKDNLSLKGYDVTLCRDGEEGERSFLANKFNLCIFDVMLPKKDGFTLARNVRKKNGTIPILFLTAKAMMEDKLE